VPRGAPEVAVTHPDGVTLLDQTPLPAKTDERRYYFRAGETAATLEIGFAHPDGEIVIPLTIWDFEDLRELRELKGTPLPRRWPIGETLPELKQGRTITTQRDIEAAKAGGPGAGERWSRCRTTTSGPCSRTAPFPLALVNVAHGCPVHGAEIYTVRPYYRGSRTSRSLGSGRSSAPSATRSTLQ